MKQPVNLAGNLRLIEQPLNNRPGLVSRIVVPLGTPLAAWLGADRLLARFDGCPVLAPRYGCDCRRDHGDVPLAPGFDARCSARWILGVFTRDLFEASP